MKKRIKSHIIFVVMLVLFMVSCAMNDQFQSDEIAEGKNEELKQAVPFEKWGSSDEYKLIQEKRTSDIQETDDYNGKFYGEYETISQHNNEVVEEDRLSRTITTAQKNSYITTVDVIAITDGITNADSDSKVYFQLYGKNDIPIFSGVYGKHLDTPADDFEKDRADRFRLSVQSSSHLIKDLRRFKIKTTGSDGWKIYGFIIIINKTHVIYSKMKIYKWVDTDNTSSWGDYISTNIEFSTNKKLSLNTPISRVDVITTTSNKKDAKSDDMVYIKFNTAEYKLDTVYDDRENNRTDYFPGLTSGGYVGNYNKIQLRLPDTDDWMFETIIVLINSKVVYYRDNIGGQIGNDGGYVWTDINLRRNSEWLNVIY